MKSGDNTSALSDLYDIQSLMGKYLDHLDSGTMNIEHTPLADIPNLVGYDYYHSDNNNKYKIIQPTLNIPSDDITFAKISGIDESAFPEQSSFVRGCIRISHKEKDN